MAYDAAYWIQQLNLTKHIEGGSFRETYRSPLVLGSECIGKPFSGPRAVSTSIYFLLEQGQFSAFHKISSDETWHFYEGDSLEIFEFNDNGELMTHRLGRDPSRGESFQVVISAGRWFGSRVRDNGNYSLVGCTVAPGFDFADFQLAERMELSAAYPDHAALIAEMTYK
ncbi:MAG: cupin domain-containing protein [Chitinophagaceae bacterium]|nr:MAG: cupin domain-containing protein [Chitinophagaceae bacterium]